VTTRHVYRIYIRSTAADVWQALVDPTFTRRWFHDTAFDAPPQQGLAYRTTMSNGDPAIEGTIEVCEPPHRLVQTWRVLYDTAMSEEPPSRVEWTVTEVQPGLVRLDVVHGDLARSPLTWANVRHGWVWVLDNLKTVVETGEPLPPDPTLGEQVSTDPTGDWHRAQGIECNNAAWEMIEAERTPANDEELLRRAYASAYHWQRAARRGPENEARAHWMLAKALLIAGQPERSLHYADACLAQCEEHGLADFDLAYALEARARALRALGRVDQALDVWAAAQAVAIADPEDLTIVEADLAEGP
jgi:uncharacterized protein YndB with AHSA1/START domain